jgi:hypothetical protein
MSEVFLAVWLGTGIWLCGLSIGFVIGKNCK